MILPCKKHNFSSIKLRFWSILRKLIFVNALPFVLNVMIKYSLFVPCNNIIEKRVFSLTWKNTCHYKYATFFILLTKSMRTPDLVTFPIFFKWWRIVELDVLRSSANFRVLLCGLHSTKSLKASWSRSDEHPGHGLYRTVVSSERIFENQLWTSWSVMTPFGHKHCKFL